MQAVQMSFPHQIPLGNGASGGWRPAQPRGIQMGWRPARPRIGQGVSIAESARVASAMMVGIAAGVSGALLAFSGTDEKPRPLLRGVGWGVLALGFITVTVNFFRVVSTPTTGATATNS